MMINDDDNYEINEETFDQTNRKHVGIYLIFFHCENHAQKRKRHDSTILTLIKLPKQVSQFEKKTQNFFQKLFLFLNKKKINFKIGKKTLNQKTMYQIQRFNQI